MIKDRFHSRGQQPCKLIGTKESFYIRKEFNSHKIGLVHQHGRRFIVLGHQDINMAAVTSCENDLLLNNIATRLQHRGKYNFPYRHSEKKEKG